MDEGSFAIGLLLGIFVGIPVGWILAQIAAGGLSRTSGSQGPAKAPHNKEFWRWTDSEGRERTAEVDRVVE